MKKKKSNKIADLFAYMIMFLCMICFIYGIKSYSVINDNNSLVAAAVVDDFGGGGGTSTPKPKACSDYPPYNCPSTCYKTTTACLEPTPKPTTSTVDSVNGGGTIYLAADEVATFNFTAISKPAGSSNFNPTWNFSPSSSASGSGNGANYTLSASGDKKGTGSNCAKTTYTVTASLNGSSKSSTATVCKYCSPWKGPITKRILSKEKRNTEKPNAGCYYYEGEQQVEGGWLYTAYYTRCCSEPTSNVGACYGNKKYLGIATDVLWQTKETSDRKYKYNGVSESDCHPINVNVCNAKPTSPLAITEHTSECEESKTISYKDTTTCSNYEGSSESNFYTIECERTISASFDYGDDINQNTSRILHKGGGFRFGIKVSSVHTCTAKFNKDTWIDAYNKYLKKIGYVSSSLVDYVKRYDYSGWTKAVNKLDASKEVKSEVFALWNTLKELRDLVMNDYVGFKPDNKYNEQANIKLTYNVNGKSVDAQEQLVISDDDFVEGVYTTTTSSKKYDLTSQLKNIPEYFVITNENNPRVVKLVPKQVYIDKYLGKGINNDQSNIDGGNKIYVDYDIDATENNKSYPINITLTGLGSNMSTVINNKCDFKVVDEEIVYRPIDITNPFINSDWKIGDNWLNDNYSFTNTIKSNIWSQNSLLRFDLSSNDISSIKESNNNFRDKYPYLGLCDRITSTNQDEITRKICNELKRTIDGFQ